MLQSYDRADSRNGQFSTQNGNFLYEEGAISNKLRLEKLLKKLLIDSKTR
jgi:hypothetical protein